jgi:hypothetical protein
MLLVIPANAAVSQDFKRLPDVQQHTMRLQALHQHQPQIHMHA